MTHSTNDSIRWSAYPPYPGGPPAQGPPTLGVLRDAQLLKAKVPKPSQPSTHP